jgi:rhamnulokinase
VTSGRWAAELAGRLGIAPDILPPLREPGERIGLWEGTPVTAVGSHDTASAVVGVPAHHERFAYISCGTWSLVGVELDSPVLSEASREANFTNEAGVDGTIRYLRNVMGLWLLQECQRAWSIEQVQPLLREAAQAKPFRSIIDPNDPSFLPHGDMPARIINACRRTGQPVPENPPEMVRCIMDSLALAHRDTLAEAQQLSGREVDAVHIVGGGARNDLLCQLTADACGLPVLAGPVEATAIGNILIQARALGAVGSTLTEMRALIRATQRIRRFEPRKMTVPRTGTAIERLS